MNCNPKTGFRLAVSAVFALHSSRVARGTCGVREVEASCALLIRSCTCVVTTPASSLISRAGHCVSCS